MGNAPQPKKDDDMPALRDVLAFLKFTPEDSKTILDGVRNISNIVGGIVSMVGAVNSVVDLMGKLGVFGPQVDPTQAALMQIGTRLNQIYGYLYEQEIKGLHVEAVVWRSRLAAVRNDLWNARISPTPLILQSLHERTVELDAALSLMLDPEIARIPFLRQVYKYSPETNHWIDAARSPFMSPTSGEHINYADSTQELQATIWDAGHYIDVLVASLKERILSTVTIEPAFRSTGYDRKQLKLLVQELTMFINAWRSAILVASPEVGFSGDRPVALGLSIPSPGAGILQNPFRPFANIFSNQSAPRGIVLGAVDPVTGIAAWESFYDRFEWVGVVRFENAFFGIPEAWGGGYDYVQAKDPPTALAVAKQQQALWLDQVSAASGLDALVELRAQLESATFGPQGSEFVQLQNASFRLVKIGINIDGSPVFALRKGVVESIDLGGLTPFAKNPEKRYAGTRYFQELEKTFRFRMALRTRRTLIQLGYRLVIGDQDIPLVPYSNGGLLGGDDLTPFPTETIRMDVRGTTQVHNVVQSHVFSRAQEDAFEAGESIPISPYSVEKWRGRMFLDERKGKFALEVEVRFEHDPTGREYSGEAVVTIRNFDPEGFPDGVIIPIMVYETHHDDNDTPRPIEVVAGSMTVHIVPSFLVMGQDYFEAYWQTMEFMGKAIEEFSNRFALQETMPRLPKLDPVWAVRRQGLVVNAMVDTVNSFRNTQPLVLADIIQQFMPPTVVETNSTEVNE